MDAEIEGVVRRSRASTSRRPGPRLLWGERSRPADVRRETVARRLNPSAAGALADNGADRSRREAAAGGGGLGSVVGAFRRRVIVGERTRGGRDGVSVRVAWSGRGGGRLTERVRAADQPPPDRRCPTSDRWPSRRSPRPNRCPSPRRPWRRHPTRCPCRSPGAAGAAVRVRWLTTASRRSGSARIASRKSGIDACTDPSQTAGFAGRDTAARTPPAVRRRPLRAVYL